MTTSWHALTPTQTAIELSTDIENGLALIDAQSRLAQSGPNQLQQPPATSPWRIFLDQFKSVMTILLVAAALIAFVLGDELEAISILVVLLLNALLGFINEYRAEKSVQALKALTVPLAKVVRDGASREKPASDLVPGDLITDVFPALALAGEPAERGIMRRPPPAEARAKRPPASFVRSIVFQGGLPATATLVAFLWTLRSSGDLQRGTTAAFLTLGLTQLFHVFNSRSESGSALAQGLFSNRAIWAAIALVTTLQLAAVYVPFLRMILKTVPPTPGEWQVVLAASLAPMVVIEFHKLIAQVSTRDAALHPQ